MNNVKNMNTSTPVNGVLINPGSGPVDGETTWDNAYENIRAYIADCEIPFDIVKSRHIPEGGRYRFVLENAEYEIRTEIDMPGLPLDRVRYTDRDDRDVFRFPCLKVDGSSWSWKYAVFTMADISELTFDRIAKNRAAGKLELHTMIALSTAHLTEETLEEFGRDGANLPSAYCKQAGGERYGWFMVVPEEGVEDNMPSDLLTLVGYARKHGADWIMLDTDAPIMQELPVYGGE